MWIPRGSVARGLPLPSKRALCSAHRQEGRYARQSLEHDLLGDKPVPADLYYGVQIARALENFHVSGVEVRPVAMTGQGHRA